MLENYVDKGIPKQKNLQVLVINIFLLDLDATHVEIQQQSSLLFRKMQFYYLQSATEISWIAKHKRSFYCRAQLEIIENSVYDVA